MSEAPEPAEAVTLRLFMDPSADAPRPTYSNYVQGNFTPEDFTLHFGWYAIPAVTERPEGRFDVPVQPVARVTIPLNLMKSLIAVLERQVAGYEANFGELPEHPNKPAWLLEGEPDQAADGGTP